MGSADSKSGNSSGFGEGRGETYNRGSGAGIEAGEAASETQQPSSARVAGGQEAPPVSIQNEGLVVLMESRS